MADEKPEPGWYELASRPGFERWWDGKEWSDHLRPRESDSDSDADVAPEPDVQQPDDATAAPSTLQGALKFIARLPLWLKIVVPSVVVIAIVVSVVLGSRVLYSPSEADYRNAFSDIATALIANGSADWTQPAAYPEPLSASDETRYEQVKSVFLDGTCDDLSEGEDAMESKIDLAIAYAKDNGISVPYTLAAQEAMITASAKYICPRYAGEADKAVGYVLLQRVIGS